MHPEIRLYAGRHRRLQCPVRVLCRGHTTPASLVCQGNSVHVQRDGDSLAFIPHSLGPYAEAVYRPAEALPPTEVTLTDHGDRVDVFVAGEELTAYRYRDAPARPFFWPLLADGGIPVTRAYPMRDDVTGESTDHRHHRSLTFAFGSVNGVDNWSEEPGHGHTRHRSVDEVTSGPVFGRLRTTSEWTDAADRPLLTQKLSATFWHVGGGCRLMDFDLHLIATHGDVLFGDTKEGGMVSVRVATSMDVQRGGRIENAHGGIDEDEAWGRAAPWCDYSGTVGSRQVGIAIMDHPNSFRHPTYWHVRDYGLFAANPFALAEYTRGAKDGSHLLREGQSLRFCYRVMVHHGSASEADVRGHYLNFAAPPRAEAAAR
ncbi:MAG TPA: PmoA family protein [Chthonomonadales bacterium]|nr:PmoA family protein [Chthonomonadales bacterium]